MAKFELFRKLRAESKNKTNPLMWIRDFKETVRRYRISNEDLLAMMEYAELENAVPRGVVESPLKTRVLGLTNLSRTFPVTRKLNSNLVFAISENGGVGVCPSSEPRHLGVLGISRYSTNSVEKPQEKRGVLLMCEGAPIGYIKMYGSRSFLSFDNLGDKNGNLLLVRGMLYAVSNEVIDLFEKISFQNKSKDIWVGVDLEDLISLGYSVNFTPQRFIEDGEVPKRILEVREELDGEEIRKINVSRALKIIGDDGNNDVMNLLYK